MNWPIYYATNTMGDGSYSKILFGVFVFVFSNLHPETIIVLCCYDLFDVDLYLFMLLFYSCCNCELF